jgi:hypothetical protein
MNIVIELTGTLDEIKAEMRKIVGTESVADTLADIPLQELFAYTGKRAEAEGYDFEIIKPAGERTLSAAEQRREEARAKLRGDLEASIKAETKVAEKPEESKEAPGAEGPKEETKPKKGKAKGAKAGNGASESPTEMKTRCMDRLHQLFNAENRKADVMKILTEHGGGAKNFSAIPDEAYGPISEALAALDA